MFTFLSFLFYAKLKILITFYLIFVEEFHFYKLNIFIFVTILFIIINSISDLIIIDIQRSNLYFMTYQIYKIMLDKKIKKLIVI